MGRKPESQGGGVVFFVKALSPDPSDENLIWSIIRKIIHASLKYGLPRIDFKQEIPGVMKSKQIEINSENNALVH